MSNTYFSFKQFTIQQDQCAMKVSTDACIQGAWTPVAPSMMQVLDVGTGTGLLSLMLAQRMPHAAFDALELNMPAVLQAAENVASSPFAARIKVSQVDATTWDTPGGYDLIICNPPFFKNSLKGPDAARNAARHTDVLNGHSLIEILLRNLSARGIASVIWPPAEHDAFAALGVTSGIYLNEALQVRDRAGSRITRVIGIYSRQKGVQPPRHELIIKSADGGYTQEFIDLLSPFYLNI